MENLNIIDGIEENKTENEKETEKEITEEKINTNSLEEGQTLVNDNEQTTSENKIEVNQNANSPMSNESKSKFYDNLRAVIKTQENILNMTGMASEKIKYANEISLDQLNTFKESSTKYGKYLKLIHEELQMIGDLMKKIKKDVKQQ